MIPLRPQRVLIYIRFWWVYDLTMTIQKKTHISVTSVESKEERVTMCQPNK